MFFDEPNRSKSKRLLRRKIDSGWRWPRQTSQAISPANLVPCQVKDALFNTPGWVINAVSQLHPDPPFATPLFTGSYVTESHEKEAL